MNTKPRSLRITLSSMIFVVALAALLIYAWLPAQLRIIDVKLGTGPAVKKGDKVLVHYVGQLSDGKEFDNSKPRGQPFEVVIGQGTVIKGWDTGMIGMQAGGVRQLVIPPEDGYGARGAPPVIPPNSSLQFEIELIKVN